MRKPEELDTQFVLAKEESLRTAGNDVVFIEHLVVTGRHLEVQVLADRQGNVSTFGVRDCSVQRRNQKIIEEPPPPHLDHKVIEEMQEAAARLIREAGYENAGTVEFLYDMDQSQFYFMEVNTRLQVEHPITEQLYGVDLVKGQLLVAQGRPLEEAVHSPGGSAIEVRLNAEDPDREFIPAPGKVVLFTVPSGPGIRVDSGIEQGSAIPSEFDSMIAKIIAYAPSRNEALARLERALREMRIKIEGGTTNRAFLVGLLQCPDIQRGGVPTRFVEDLLRDHNPVIRRDRRDIALIACAIDQAIARYQEELMHFRQQWSSIGQPRGISSSRGYEITLQLSGHTYVFLVKALGGNVYHLKIDGQLLIAQYVKRNHEAVLHYGNQRSTIQMVSRDDTLHCEIDGTPYYIETESSDHIKAPFPAVVIATVAAPGQAVEKGDLLLQLEAMKMVMSIEAPKSGKVKTLHVREGEQVYAGQPLIQLDTGEQPEPGAESGEESSHPRVMFDPPQLDDSAYTWQILERELLAVFLGYDYEGEEGAVTAIFESLVDFARKNPRFQQEVIRCFLAALEIYTAVEALFSHRRIESEGFAGASSFQELLMHFFIRNDCQKEGLPQEFLDSLERAIRWYPNGGQNEHDRFNQALFRIYKSHAHLAIKQTLLGSILRSLKEFPDIRVFGQRVSDLLDEIAQTSQNQLPHLADAAIQARYYLIDSMFLQTMKEERKQQLERLVLASVGMDENRQERAELTASVANTGHYMVFELVALALDPVREHRTLALKLLGRYFNRDRRFIAARIEEENGLLLCRVSSMKDKEHHETIVAVSDSKGWAKNADRIQSCLGRARNFEKAQCSEKPELIALIAVGGDRDEEKEEMVIQHLYRQVLPVRWCCLGLFYEHTACSYRTFTIDQEEKWRENLHRHSFNPLFYRELKLHLFSHFNLKILSSSESVSLILAVARNNQNDKRLLALVDVPESRAEVGEDNSIARIIAFDYALMEAIYAMNAERSRGEGPCYLNRISIHVHSLLTVNLQQITDYARKLTPRGRELGLEKVIIFTRRRKESDRKENDRRESEGFIHEFELHLTNISQDHFALDVCPPSTRLLQPMTDDYVARIVRARSRVTPDFLGLIH